MAGDDPRRDAKEAGIPIPRRIPFTFPDELDPRWHPRDPEFAAMVNGASLTMPYLEPFLIRTLREVVQQLDDPRLVEYGRAFNAQEQCHYQTHRRFNDLLKARRYPELVAVEQQMAASYVRLSQRSLRTRMAYTAGFESMTAGVTQFLVDRRVALFGGADARVASFVLWHFVEETEHKCVAYDVYQAAFGGSLSGYLARMIGVFHGSLDVMVYSMKGYRHVLRRDGLWNNLRSRLHLARRLGQFCWYVLPRMVCAALPGHDPRHVKDPQWVRDWIAGYAQAHPDSVPLVDTRDPLMPVPFPVSESTLEIAT
ncbi:MAG: metal-dependent hydrolase [Nevskiaceae bacterium]|nr:MAG: metal-dependent hydrolase [Nevskiaceae bacterium]TBR72602.1 MAG: metal-dependent hydrolase [Nevskiaceae bacterium]